MTLERVRFLREWTTYIFLFLLPWQTRWIVSRATLAGVPWEQGTISVYAIEILFWAILILGVIENRLSGGRLVWSGRDRFLRVLPILLVSVAVIRTAFARDFPTAAINTLHIVEGVAMFLFILRTERVDRAAAAFIAGMIPAAGLGVWQFLAQSSPASTLLGLAAHSPEIPGASVVETVTGRFLRAYGPFPHPNIFGGYLAVALIFGARLVSSRDKVFRRLALWSSPLLAAALFLTFSRGAWLAFFAGAGLFFIQAIRNFDVRHRGFHWFAASTLPFLILGSLLFSLVVTRTTSVGRLEARSVSERTQGYRDAFSLIRRHPLFGVGPGQASLASYRDIDPARGPYTYEPVHNLFLLVWVELGIVGFALIVSIFWFIFRRSIPTDGLPLLATLLILGLFDHYLWSYLPGVLLLWLGLAQSAKPSS